MVFLKGGKIGYTQTLLDGVRREMFNLPRVPGLDQIQRPTGQTPGGVGGEPPSIWKPRTGGRRSPMGRDCIIGLSSILSFLNLCSTPCISKLIYQINVF